MGRDVQRGFGELHTKRNSFQPANIYYENLQNTFQVIKESGLKLNKEKCEIKKNKLTYFGHVLSAEGVSPDREGEGNNRPRSTNQCARTTQTDWHD